MKPALRRVPTPAERRDHIHKLARAFDVRVIESDQLRPDEALALTGMRIVLCRPVVDETSDAVALHELGHLVAALGVVRRAAAPGADYHNLLRIEEAAAWEWARHYALDWTPAMEAVAQWAEQTYAPAAPAASPEPATAQPAPRIDWSQYR